MDNADQCYDKFLSTGGMVPIYRESCDYHMTILQQHELAVSLLSQKPLKINLRITIITCKDELTPQLAVLVCRPDGAKTANIAPATQLYFFSKASNLPITYIGKNSLLSF